MKFWIGVILFSFLITTKQQSQNPEDVKEENEDPSLLIPLNPVYSSLNTPNTPIHVDSKDHDSAGEQKESESVAEFPHEVPKDNQNSIDESVPLFEGEASILETASNLKTDTNEEPEEAQKASTSDAEVSPGAESEPLVSERKDFEKLSIIIEQDIINVSEPISEVSTNITLPESEKPGTESDSEISGEGVISDKETTKEEGTILDDSESNKSEDSIPSFSEWTRLQLAQRKESIINNIKDKTSLQEGKNFASPDCGAKIVASNPEAQNPSGAISSSHDEYMLNRCTVHTWLVLELCEPLRIEKVALGNLELFSSSPNEFELGVSDRYPSRDWTTIGPFFAPAFRNLHAFKLPSNDTTFGKFLKVVVKSHHGKEHYCPLSLIKVFGKSEYEVLESETTHAEDIEQSNNAVEEEEISGDDTPATQSVIGSAAEAVVQMVKKAANAVFNVSEADRPAPSTNTTAAVNLSCISLPLAQCIPEVMHREEVIHNLSCQSNLLNWTQRIMSWCGWEFCHETLKTKSIGSPWMTEGFAVALFGPAFIDAACNYRKPMYSCDLREEEQVVQLTSGVPNDTQTNEVPQSQTPITPEAPAPTAPNNGHAQLQQPISESSPPPPQINFPVQTEEPAQKESVFVRLSNRIKALERNQSLSSGYLEELSQRFKKQSEELIVTHDLFRKTLNESLSKCKSVEESLRYNVKRLTRSNENLRELVWRVELQRGGMVFFSIVQLLCTIIFWWRSQKSPPSPASLTAATNPSVTNSQRQNETESGVPMFQRKRTNSEQLKKVRKKKKKNEGFNGNGGGGGVPPLNGGLKFEFKTPAISEQKCGGSSSSASTFSSLSGISPTNVPNKMERPGTPLSVVTNNTTSDESQPASKKKSKLMSLFGSKN